MLDRVRLACGISDCGAGDGVGASGFACGAGTVSGVTLAGGIVYAAGWVESSHSTTGPQ